jgi:hypothetical protein
LTLDTNTHAARTRTGTCTHVRNRSPSSPPRARGESEILGTTVAPPGAQNFFTWSIYCNMHAARTRTGTHGRARTSGPGLSDLANKSVDIIAELHVGGAHGWEQSRLLHPRHRSARLPLLHGRRSALGAIGASRQDLGAVGRSVVPDGHGHRRATGSHRPSGEPA